MRRLPSVLLCPLPLLVVWSLGCATANLEEEEDKTDARVADASIFVPPDAKKNIVDAGVNDMIDSAIPIDAAVVIPDAEVGNLFCDEHDECASDHCCFLSLCVRGDVILDTCFPD